MSWPGGTPGHWHGYGPWIGPPKVYAQEGNRRPAHPNGAPVPSGPDDKQTQRVLDRYREAAADFQNGTVPPLMTGHWLMKRSHAAIDRTWTDVSDAVVWLNKNYSENPPFERDDGKRAYSDLDGKIAYSREALRLGTDVSWVYYLQSQNLLSMQVVCCPNHFHPDLACPLPPR